MQVWTLASDESGAFDPGEPHASLVGGVLLSQAADQLLDLRDTLRHYCAREGIGYPPHSTDLRRLGKPNAAEELLTIAADWLSRRGGIFLALLGKSVPANADPALHARMLGAFIDLSARIASAQGAKSLDLRPATRSFLMKEQQADAAQRVGLHVEDKDNERWFHGILGTEAREALDALARSPEGRLPAWPKVNSVQVVTAKWQGVHPGVLAADLFCNRVYVATREDAGTTALALSEQVARWDPRTICVVDYSLLPLVADVDRALRKDPPRLLELGVALSKIESARRTFRGSGPSFLLGIQGAAQVADLFLTRGEHSIAEACQSDKNLAWAIAQSLASDVQSELDLKHGKYEGTGWALRLGFSGDGPVATAVRAIADRELVARLHRLTLECCNHTGDVDGAERARNGFARTLSAGASLVLLGEALKVENLSNVALQNQLPCAAEEAPELLSRLAASANNLKDLASQMSQPVFAFVAVGPQPAPQGAPALDDDEKALRELTGFPRTFARSDREHGRCLGTGARTLGFIGELDAARTLALDARTYFEDSPFDLAFNAAVLARIELERARISPQTSNGLLITLLLKMSGADALRQADAVASQIRSDPSRRFAFDLILRQLLWAPQVSNSFADSALIDHLVLGKQSAIYETLFAEPSHPSELIARHIAELLRQRNRKQKVVHYWFELSLEVAASSPTPTLQRMAMFTRHLAEGRAADGPRGSVLNPSFEYR
jgi:hypothetical protein